MLSSWCLQKQILQTTKPHKLSLNDSKLAEMSVDKCNIELVSHWYTESLGQSAVFGAKRWMTG